MNLKLEENEIRIRLNSWEWQKIQTEKILFEKFHLGQCQALSLELTLSEESAFSFDPMLMQIAMDHRTIQEPQRKKDPYWTWQVPEGPRLCLDVDIFPGRERG